MIKLAQKDSKKGTIKMFCPNCGKEVKENDNFCRYCGHNLQEEISVVETQTAEVVEQTQTTDDVEEVVLYVVKKHWIDLVVPAFLIPLFFFYFWNIFLNTHSFFSWIITFALLGFIFYPIARYKSDRMIITNKFVHIKVGILNPEEVDISLNDIDVLGFSQSSMGKFFDYGFASYINNGEKRDYGSIRAPKALEYIIENTQKFVEECMD